jgi:rSAM/selenodomain-associated transferase 2
MSRPNRGAARVLAARHDRLSTPTPDDARLSIVIPALNEAAVIEATLDALAPVVARGHEVIVDDGGSNDDTAARARAKGALVLGAPRGRARQMNAGAAQARHDTLLFLHADSRLPAEADRQVLAGLAASRRAWGRFDVAIAGRSLWLRVVAWFMNRRSRLTGIATGDQAMFVRRDAFRRVGGFPPIALMEDIELSRRLKRLSPPLCLAARTVTSGRRWEARGVWRTILRMWRVRLAYFLGADPERLRRAYERA